MPRVDSPAPAIVILGGGCAGLSAGLRLVERGYPVVLLEKSDHVGGLAGGIRLNGNIYEFGPHIFHSTNPEILNSVKSLLGKDLIEYHRTIKIKFFDQYFKFPLSMRDVLLKLPPWTVLRAAVSFVFHFIRGAIVTPRVPSSETLLKRYYGNVLYKIFFKSYIERVWGLTPAQMSASFAQQRIPRMNLLEVFGNFAQKMASRLTRHKTDTTLFVEKVEGPLYTTRQGFSMITERMAERFCRLGGVLHLNAQVRHLTRDQGHLTHVAYQQEGETKTIPCSAVMNTLPINEMLRMIEPSNYSPDLSLALSEIQFRCLVFVGLLVKRRHVLPASFMYFREHSFNRISDLSYFSFDIEPEGSTLLVAEVTCGRNDRSWKDEPFITETVISELVAEKLLDRSEILESHVFRAEHAYPIYKLGYEKHLSVLLGAVDRMKNLETAGRQGRFQYVNTHIVMQMAHEAVERLLKKMAEYPIPAAAQNRDSRVKDGSQTSHRRRRDPQLQ